MNEGIFRARLLVPMGGLPPIENGAIAVVGERIFDVGIFPDVQKRNRGTVNDLGDCILMPGLVNAHCHLDYTCLRGRIAPPIKTFTDWIRAINQAKAALTPKDYVASINEGFAEAKRFGTVALANLTAFPELIARVDPILRTRWFAELIDVRPGSDPQLLVEQAMRGLEATEFRGLAPHAPFTASASLFQYCEQKAKGSELRLTTHLAESRDEMGMFRDAAGPLYDFLSGLGRDMSDCGDRTPVARFVGMTSADQPWLVAHLNELDESDFALLAQSGRRFDVVHCPRSHRFFGHTPFPAEKLKALGFRISLGTDSLASNEDLNLFADMREFQTRHPTIPSEEICAMVTTSAADAVGEGANLGRLAPGYLAAVIAVPFRGLSREAYDAIIDFKALPKTGIVLRHGQ